MSFIDRFKRNKKEAESVIEPEEKKEEKPNLLKQLCGGDTALHEDLSRLAPFNLGLIKDICQEAMQKAYASRTIDDYRHAASLAIPANDLGVFNEALDLYAAVATPSDRKFERAREVSEKALGICQELYQKQLEDALGPFKALVMKLENVSDVVIGRKVKGNMELGYPCLTVYVKKKVPLKDLGDSGSIPPTYEHKGIIYLTDVKEK